MNPSKFNKRITFKKEINTTDDEGYNVTQLVDVKTVWCMIKTMTGKEFVEANTTQNEVTSRFVIRYTSDLSPDMLIDFKGRSFSILSIINDDEMNKTLTVIGKELV